MLLIHIGDTPCPSTEHPNIGDTLIKTYPSVHLLFAIPAQQCVQRPYGHPSNKAYSAIPMPPLAIPAQAGIQHRKRALRAPSGQSEGAAGGHKLAPPPAGAIARMCAFRALFALDSRPCSSQGQALRGNGGYLLCQWVVFRAVLDFRGFCTACFAGMAGIAELCAAALIRASRSLWRCSCHPSARIQKNDVSQIIQQVASTYMKAIATC